MPQEVYPAAEGLPQLHWGPSQTQHPGQSKAPRPLGLCSRPCHHSYVLLSPPTHTRFTLLCCTSVHETEPAESCSPLPCAFCWFNFLNWLCRGHRSAVTRSGETRQEVKSCLNCCGTATHMQGSPGSCSASWKLKCSS